MLDTSDLTRVELLELARQVLTQLEQVEEGVYETIFQEPILIITEMLEDDD